MFNEITASILRCLEHGPLPVEVAKECTEVAIGARSGELVNEDFAFAMRRLEELGLIDCVDEAVVVQ